MIGSMVVGTDGSDTAGEAVRQAAQLAQQLGAKVHLVSAYEPVPEGRLREERQQVPGDLQWMVNPREDVDDTLSAAAQGIKDNGVEVETHAREGHVARAVGHDLVGGTSAGSAQGNRYFRSEQDRDEQDGHQRQVHCRGFGDAADEPGQFAVDQVR